MRNALVAVRKALGEGGDTELEGAWRPEVLFLPGGVPQLESPPVGPPVLKRLPFVLRDAEGSLHVPGIPHIAWGAVCRLSRGGDEEPVGRLALAFPVELGAGVADDAPIALPFTEHGPVGP